jgi:hypothetical protein
MPSVSLLQESLVHVDGVSPSIDVSRVAGKLFVVTLGITRILEQQNLEVSIWASPDGTGWGTEPLTSFPPKSYCGLYSILLNLARKPPVRYVRVQWKMHRWSKSPENMSLLCAFYLDAEESGSRVITATRSGSVQVAAVA